MVKPVLLLDSAPQEALNLIKEFGLQTCHTAPHTGEYLVADASGISLCKTGEKGRVQVDFSGGAAQYRRLKGGGELIAKAVNHTTFPSVWDATGGLGRDAFVLASLGLAVRISEQNPAVACLLADGIRRAQTDETVKEITARLTLTPGDSIDLLQAVGESERPDIVYLDPMYPERRKAAAVKKEMAYFHGLVGSAQNEAPLLKAAKMAAKKRVVVKRPRLGEFLNQEQPAYQYSGKSVRFDVYMPDNPEYTSE
ncbi:16S rRNA methyltransferase [Neisseria arctica]|uniref:Ribosomal RNA small subunit methyltransferase J n=1 Tax=Neisseria arctica TaxID=1470200 RepID=A0A0J0YV03_9NEIS|nr:class I SAM-dependent methyltransferase [Neisseria arctica]KLT73917.1 16S rRNA methyltransferase [Neisseria arctica]UOO86888.1 class I SAM-dependent methyltransferase [Neisseria arctica]